MSNITLSSNTTSISVNSSTNAITVGSTPSVITVGAAQTVSNTAIRAAIGNTFPIQYDVSTGIISSGVSNVFPILYDVSTGVISIDEDAIVDETVVDNGNKSGNITLDLNAGRLHKVTLNGDVTGITFANVVSGRSATVILTQDSLGGNELDTTTFTSNWTAWNFANQFTSLDNNPNAWNVLSVFYDGTNYYASLVVEQALQIQNSELANSNIIVNGTTINLGSSGQISNLTGLDTGDLAEGTNLYYTQSRFDTAFSGKSTSNLSEGTNLYYTDARVDSHLSGGYGITYTSGVIETTNVEIQAQANSAITTYFGDANNFPFTFNGNIQVQGNIDYVNVEDLLVNDQSITLNYGNVLQDAFVYIDRTGLNNAHIKWNETSDQWEIYDGTSTYVIPRSTSDLAEGTNLYWTTDRGNTNSDAWLTTKTTTDLAEGTNLYFSNTNLATSSTTHLPEGTNLYFTTDRANSAIEAHTGNIANLTGDVTTTGNITGGYILAGNDAGGDGIFIGDINGAIQQEVRNDTGVTIARGKAVYLTGVATGSTPHVALANAEVASEMPAIGVVKNNIPDTETGEIVISGQLNIGTHGFTIGSQLFINGDGDLTETIPVGEGNLVQKIGKVVTSSQIIVQGAGRTNATPNLNDGKFFLGNAANRAATAVFTDESNTAIADYLIDTGTQKKAHTVFVQDLALSPDAANAQLGFYFPNGSGSAGQVLKFDSATQLTQATLDTGNVTETTNLFYTDARVQSNTAADTGLVHTTGTETVGGAKSFTSAMTVTPSVTVGGDITNAEIGIKEFHTPSAGSLMGGGGLLRTTYGRGTEASPVYGKDGDLTFRFIGVGYREGPVATTGGIFGFQQDGGNVSGAVPMAAVFRNATQYTGFSHTGVDNNGKSDVYLTEAFASKQNKAHVTDTLIIGNHDPKQATPATANLTIGHTDVDETEGRSIYLWFAAGSGIQSYAGAFDITSTGVPPINSDTVCIGMNAMPRHKAGTIDSGSDTTTFAGDTWIGDYLADGTAVTINGSPTSNAANADGQTYYTKALAEFDFAYAPSRTGLVTYALYTDSALTTPLVWGSGGLNAPGTPSADGNDYSGWADIQFTSGDFTKKIPTAQTTTTGSGTGAEFFVSKKGTSYTGVGSYTSHLTKYNRVGFGAEPMAKGSGYAVTDTVEIDGSYLGGVSGTHNLTFTIDSVDGGGGVTSVGNISGTAYDPATSTWSFEKEYTSDTLSIKHNGTEKLSLTTTQTEFLSIPILPQYSNTSLPAASNPGGMIFVTNGNDKPAYSNGSAWLYVFDNSAVT